MKAVELAVFRRDVIIRYCSTNLGFALVRWTHPRGLPPASAALGGTGKVGGSFGERKLCVVILSQIQNKRALSFD